jgi:antitoxin (DNA-binding transcriptional repressor) of toxin-antitoxin stability system
LVASGSYLEVMRAVCLKVLKNKLSEYVRLAAGGETVLITARDRVVAELVPPALGRASILDNAVLADVVRRGCLTPPIVPSEGEVPRRPVACLASLLEELDGDREDR